MCENTILACERAGLISAVRLPSSPDSKRPRKRYYVEDVKPAH